jgi:8-oxo-dGTP pyrophosphatase MutT (NUDIX family)
VGEYLRRLRELVGGSELLQCPSVSIALRDDARRVLLAKHSATASWVLPGGAVEPGETPADAALREMWEETGLRIRLTRLVGLFGGSEFVVNYRNGHRTSYVMAVFEASAEEATAAPDETELLELRFVSDEEARSLPVAPWVPEVLRALHRGGSPWFRPPEWRVPHGQRGV